MYIVIECTAVKGVVVVAVVVVVVGVVAVVVSVAVALMPQMSLRLA